MTRPIDETSLTGLVVDSPRVTDLSPLVETGRRCKGTCDGQLNTGKTGSDQRGNPLSHTVSQKLEGDGINE
jgi:hypothetical protein